MKLAHIINLILITLSIIGICVCEEVIASKSLVEVQSRCFQIESLLEESTSLKTNAIVLAVDNLEDVWLEQESVLCYLVNHKNIQEIGQEISKIKTYITNDNIDSFKVSITLIKSYCKSYMHFLGANVHNVL